MIAAVAALSENMRRLYYIPPSHEGKYNKAGAFEEKATTPAKKPYELKENAIKLVDHD